MKTGNEKPTNKTGFKIGVVFGQRLFAKGVSLLSTIFLARFLEPSGYGVYAYILAIVGVTTTIAALGFPSYTIRKTAPLWDRGEPALGMAFFGVANRTVLVASAGAALLAVGAFWLTGYDRQMLGTLTWAVAVGALLIAIIAGPVSANGMALLKGMREPVRAAVPELLVRPSIVLIGALFIALFAEPNRLAVALAFAACAYVCSYVITFQLIRKATDRSESSATWPTSYFSTLKASLPFLLVAGAGMLNRRLDVIMLGAISGADEVGVYRVAVGASESVGHVLFAANSVIGPRMAALWGSGQMQAAQRLLRKNAWLVALAGLPPAIGLIVFRNSVIEIVFGPAYAGAGTPLLILMAGWIVHLLTGTSRNTLNMTGKEHASALLLAVSTLVNAALNALLIPSFGSVGAAWATTITMTVLNLSMIVLLWRSRGIAAFPH